MNNPEEKIIKKEETLDELESRLRSAAPSIEADAIEEAEPSAKQEEILPQATVPSPDAAVKETVVSISRVTKVVSGGKRLAFSAIVVAGNGNGKVGVGKGKARDVQSAIAKASYQGKKHMRSVPLEGTSISYVVIGNFGAAKVMLQPAAPGTGVIAGGAIRAVLEACGVRDILTKNLGTSNAHNVLHATMDALSQLKTKEELARKRGKKVEDL